MILNDENTVREIERATIGSWEYRKITIACPSIYSLCSFFLCFFFISSATVLPFLSYFALNGCNQFVGESKPISLVYKRRGQLHFQYNSMIGMLMQFQKKRTQQKLRQAREWTIEILVSTLFIICKCWITVDLSVLFVCVCWLVNSCVFRLA